MSKKATCLNCERQNMTIQARGLCAKCYSDRTIRASYAAAHPGPGSRTGRKPRAPKAQASAPTAAGEPDPTDITAAIETVETTCRRYIELQKLHRQLMDTVVRTRQQLLEAGLI